jgi:AcrR family transcriptional regulator
VTGRPRDSSIDAALLTAALEELAAAGYEGMSMSSVAARAGTTRTALYRRFDSKADLATAAIGSMSEAADRPATDDPFADLVAELEAFRRGVSRPNGVSLVGAMLQTSAEADMLALFRRRIVEPRRRRLIDILERAGTAGLIDHDADIGMTVTTLTGSWYAMALAGTRHPKDWAVRVARLAWRGLGGGAPGGSGPSSDI